MWKIIYLVLSLYFLTVNCDKQEDDDYTPESIASVDAEEGEKEEEEEEEEDGKEDKNLDRSSFEPINPDYRKPNSESSKDYLPEYSDDFFDSDKLAKRRRPSENKKKFRKVLKKSKNIVIITGEGVSAESGVPTFVGSGAYTRSYRTDLIQNPVAFEHYMTALWGLIDYRRELVFHRKPNKIHKVIAEFEKHILFEEKKGRKVTIITQSIDSLHIDVGSKNTIELHGTLFKTQCLRCDKVFVNKDIPIYGPWMGNGNRTKINDPLPPHYLPYCPDQCDVWVMPYVFWLSEDIPQDAEKKAEKALEKADLIIAIGMRHELGPIPFNLSDLAANGAIVAEFHTELNEETHNFKFFFEGNLSKIVPKALKI